MHATPISRSPASGPVFPPTPTDDEKIILQVGERTFYTTRDSLTDRSMFFASLLSGRWDSRQPDGSYFIDADPKLFDHILQYLRRGVFPIFFDNTKGHDYALYLALLEEAKYFQIPRLEKWLQDKVYLKAIRIEYVFNEPEDLTDTTTSDIELKHHLERRTREIYICPRGIFVHRGKPSMCGRQCKNALEIVGSETEKEEYLDSMVIAKKVVLVSSLCLDTPDLEL